MKTSIILSVFLFLFSVNINAQSETRNINIDSIISITENDRIHDTLRIEANYFLAREFVYRNPDSAEIFATKGLDFSKEINFLNGVGQGYGWLGYLNAEKGNIAAAIDYDLKSLKIVQLQGYEDAYPTILNNLAMLHLDLENYDQANAYFEECLKINQRLGRQKSTATNYNNLALIQKNTGNYGRAIDFYEKSLAIRVALNDEIGLGYTYSNLGTVYEQLDSSEKALELYQLSLSYRKNNRLNKGTAASYYKIANILSERNERLEQALSFALKAYQIGVDFKYKYELKEAAKVVARIYAKRKDFKNAYAYYQIYANVHDSINNIENQDALIRSRYEFEFNQKHLLDSLEKDKVLIENKLLVNENKVNESRISIQRLWLVISFLVVCFLVVLLVMVRKNTQMRMDRLRSEIRLRLAETMDLRNALAIQKNETISLEGVNVVLKEKLSPRESEILDALVLGLSNKEIGEKLFLSVNTIKTHILSLYAKLDVNNRTQAAVKGSMLKIKEQSNPST